MRLVALLLRLTEPALTLADGMRRTGVSLVMAQAPEMGMEEVSFWNLSTACKGKELS